MTTITVRNVPEATRDELAARAAASGRSLQEFLRASLIELADRPDERTLVARVRERKRHAGSSLTRAQILRHLHAERR